MMLRHMFVAATLAASFAGAGSALAAHSRYDDTPTVQPYQGYPPPGYRGGYAADGYAGFDGSGPPTDRDPQEGYLPRLSAATGTLCVKQCPNDQLPCDPPYFKQADGRCSDQWR